MTLPPSLPDLDSESIDEQELGRIAVLIGGLLVDIAAPTGVPCSAIVNDVIELANDQLHNGAGTDFKFDNSEGKWTFARLTGETIDPYLSLAEAGIYDGELLAVEQVGAPSPSSLVDDLEGIAESCEIREPRFAAKSLITNWWLALAIAASGATALLPSQTPRVGDLPIAALTVLIAGIGCAIGSFVVALRSAGHKARWLAGAALPLIFGGSLHIVPGVHGISALAVALALTALVALLQLLGSRRGRPLYTAVVALAVFGVPAVVAPQLISHPNPRAVGAILATVAVIVVYLAPRATILLSGLPVPRVPTAGEPLDDIETQGGTAVYGVNAVGKQVIPTEEGMTQQVRRAREYLTGLVAAAAILAAIGCYFALDVSAGFYWQGAAFGLAVAAVLCLRGRSHHDLAQSAVLIGGGLLIAFSVIAKIATFVDGWQVKAGIGLVLVTALLVTCGLVAPQQDFSPVMRRRLEILEYLAIGMVFPLAGWIIRLYPFFREMLI